jgi:hypothetical protein
VSDLLQVAATGRAKCRGCGRAITKGELRFGESLPNPYREGEAVYWFHLVCAACMRPEKLLGALKTHPETVPDSEWLEQTAELGTQYYRLPRIAHAERSPSARARCRMCRDLIEKSIWRIALQIFEEGRMSPSGYIHLGCSEAYFGTAALLERLVRLTPELSETEISEVELGLSEQRRAPAEAAEAAPLAKAGSADTARPSVAKAGMSPDSEPQQKHVAKR